jgi:hypothetical protein
MVKTGRQITRKKKGKENKPGITVVSKAEKKCGCRQVIM